MSIRRRSGRTTWIGWPSWLRGCGRSRHSPLRAGCRSRWTAKRWRCSVRLLRAARCAGGARKPLHAGYELFYPVVHGAERVLAQDGALRLVVELEMDPVDGEVPPLLLSPFDEVASEPGASGLRGDGLGLEDAQVAGDPVDGALALEQVVETATAVDVVVGEVDLGDA